MDCTFSEVYTPLNLWLKDNSIDVFKYLENISIFKTWADKINVLRHLLSNIMFHSANAERLINVKYRNKCSWQQKRKKKKNEEIKDVAKDTQPSAAPFAVDWLLKIYSKWFGSMPTHEWKYNV